MPVSVPPSWSQVTGDPRWQEADAEKRKAILSNWSRDVTDYGEANGDFDIEKHLNFIASQTQAIEFPAKPDEELTPEERVKRMEGEAMYKAWGSPEAQHEFMSGVPFYGVKDAAAEGMKHGKELVGDNIAGKTLGAGLAAAYGVGTAFNPVVKLGMMPPRAVQATAEHLGGDDESALATLAGEREILPNVQPAATESTGKNFVSELYMMARKDPVNTALIFTGVTKMGATGFALRMAEMKRPLPEVIAKNFPETREIYDAAVAKREARGIEGTQEDIIPVNERESVTSEPAKPEIGEQPLDLSKPREDFLIEQDREILDLNEFSKEAEKPAVADAPIPEAPETITAQIQWLKDGKRKAVFFPRGTEIPDPPQGIKAIGTEKGIFYFDPKRVTANEIRLAVDENRIGSILDYGIEAKPQEPVGAVVVRSAEWIEKQAVVTDRANLPSVTEAAKRIADKGDKITLENPETVVKGRLNRISSKPIEPPKMGPEELGRMTDEQVIDSVAERYVHEFKPEIQDSIKSEAKQMQKDVLGGEAGRRVPRFDDADPYSKNPEFARGERGYQFTGIASTYPDWYGPLKRSKEDVMKALQKIINDKGSDKGKFVERLKRIIAERKLQGFMDKEAGPIPPDMDFVRSIGREINEHFKHRFEEKPQGYEAGSRVDPRAIEEYISSRGIEDPKASQILSKNLDEVARQSEEPYQPELPLQGAEAKNPVDRLGSRSSAILEPGKLQAGDFNQKGRVSLFVEKLLTRKIPSFDIRGKTIETARDFAMLLQPLRSPLFESLKVAFLDEKGKVVHSQVLTVGSLSETIGNTRDFIASLGEAKRRGKTSRAIIAHNHPSGFPEPSLPDVRMTKLVQKAFDTVGVELVDHVITNGKKFYSFTKEAVMDLDAPLQPWEKARVEDALRVQKTETFKEVVEGLRQANPDKAHVIYVNSKMGVIAVDRFSLDQLKDSKEFTKHVVEGATSQGSMGVFVDLGTETKLADARPMITKLQAGLESIGASLFDLSDRASPSHRSLGLFEESTPRRTPKLAENVVREEPADYRVDIGKEGEARAEAITKALTTGETIESAGVRAMKLGEVVRKSAVDILRKSGGKLAQLGDRIARYFDDRDNLTGARTAPFQKINDSMSRSERKTAMTEFERFMQTREEARRTKDQGLYAQAQELYQAMSPGGKALVDEVGRLFAYTGEVNAKLKIQNRNPITGEVKPIGNYGAEYWPRILKDDVREALSNPRSKPALHKALIEKIMVENGFASVEQAERFLSASGALERGNNYMGNLEVARVGNLPAEFYEHKFEKVIPQFIVRWSDRVSQIKHFGQKIGESTKDIFDKTIEGTTDRYTKEYLGHVRDRIYAMKNQSDAARWAGRLRTFATLTKLTSGWSSIRNLASVFTNTVPEFGVRAAVPEGIKTLLSFGKRVRETEAAGALKADLVAAFSEAWDLSEAQQKVTGTALRYTGFSLVEQFNRTHAAFTARAWARWALKQIESNPNSRTALIAQAKFEKYGIDFRKLQAEGLEGREGKKLMRSGAMNTQFNYDLRQVPLWAESPTAKFLFQFQKFSLQQLRRFSDDVVKPMVKGYQVNGRTVRDYRPFVYMMTAAFATGETLYMLRDVLFGKGRTDASLQEIANTSDEDETRAITLGLQRVAHDMVYAGGFGALGDWGSNIEAFATRGRAKSPIDPPGLSTLKNVWNDLVRVSWEQGKLTGHDVKTFLKNDIPLLSYTESAYLQASGDELYDAQKKVRTIKQLGYRYSTEMGLPTASGSQFAKSPNSPLFRELQEALLVGDYATAKSLMDGFVGEATNMADKKKRILALKASVRMRQPFKAGAIDSENERLDFKAWAVKRAGVEELADLNELETTYVRTASKLGLMPNKTISLDAAMKERRKQELEASLSPR